MVASENDAFHRKANTLRDALHVVDKVSRRHAGIAAVLIDLIGRRLDENLAATAQRLLHDGADNKFVRTAAGINARVLPGVIAFNHGLNGMHYVLLLFFRQGRINYQHFAFNRHAVFKERESLLNVTKCYF